MAPILQVKRLTGPHWAAGTLQTPTHLLCPSFIKAEQKIIFV